MTDDEMIELIRAHLAAGGRYRRPIEALVALMAAEARRS